MNSSAQHSRSERNFLVRTCVDRLAGDGDHTIAEEMNEVAVRDSNGDPDEFTVKLIFDEFYLLGRSTSYHLLVPTWSFVGPSRAVTVKGGAGHREATCS
jgi:hypothetical protein